LGTILVVDDELEVRAMARDWLVAAGYTVLEACSGEEALRVSECYDARIELLLTDIVMPGMNGVELAERLIRQRPDVKVLYMSGFAVISAEPGLSSGPGLQPGDPIIPKPFTTDALHQKVQGVLRTSKPGRSPFSRPPQRSDPWGPERTR
jgi:CheY-like chemotaxis protein